jgi:UDP-N-acetyl-D-mannosaminuronic acid transferase (WecB/TagA/CpsF family)
MSQFREILGIRFFAGTACEAVELASRGGLVVVPSAPVLLELVRDKATREALLGSDLALTDSGLMVLLWNWLKRDQIPRVSGLEYLKLLLDHPALCTPGATFWIMPGVETMEKSLAWLRTQGHATTRDDCYLAPRYPSGAITDPELLEIVRVKRPVHIIMAIGGGVQERLAWYLKWNLDYLPGIHCTGAAISFLTGDQVRIPMWADRWRLGWFFRCLSAPHRFVPRYWKARKLIRLLWKYKERLPPMNS